MKFDKKRGKKNCEPSEQEPPVEIMQSLAVDEMVEDYLLRTRRIWIVGEINEMMATHVCSYLQMFSLLDDPIYLYINSPGGCVSSGYAIIDQMQSCICPIYTVVKGQAHSMAAMITAFGTNGCRYASPNSSMMLHSMIIHSPPDSIDRHSTMLDFVKEDYVRKINGLARRTKMSPKQLMSVMDETRRKKK